MRRFVEEADRGQRTLLPECLDDFIDENNPVRAIDEFVDALDLAEMCFGRATPAATGRPSYHPSVLLKLYIYGYLNRVQSSRRLVSVELLPVARQAAARCAGCDERTCPLSGTPAAGARCSASAVALPLLPACRLSLSW